MIGIFLALIGTNPVTNVVRGTFGWDYLNDGLQLMPVIAGYLQNYMTDLEVLKNLPESH